jgi:hypothetical protein
MRFLSRTKSSQLVYMLIPLAGVAELVDALDSGSSVRKGCASSNLALGTMSN